MSVLVSRKQENLDWVPASLGSVPPGALQGGHTDDGEALYIGRYIYEGTYICGKAKDPAIVWLRFRRLDYFRLDYFALITSHQVRGEEKSTPPPHYTTGIQENPS
ncbi:unnamed protein product [Darwinula stevensoni]|uniref:Uncharacterized protein n=1 Tax=Darwinula stevensoni TaxID=69355 RepID=A0A7R8X144_9CRUS|nr:unnamed protein product [Darwinula stevensoni]CAG0882416.1 unnamed protein product [Darwinula stevensoni]